MGGPRGDTASLRRSFLNEFATRLMMANVCQRFGLDAAGSTATWIQSSHDVTCWTPISALRFDGSRFAKGVDANGCHGCVATVFTGHPFHAP